MITVQKSKSKSNRVLVFDQNGLSLEFASDEIKDDKEKVLKAVRKNGRALQ